MTASATIIINGTVVGNPTGSRVIGPLSISSTNANGQVTEIVLQSGANTITVPSSPSTTGCVIVLPSANTSTVTLKGITGDTGLGIGKTTTTVLNWDSSSPPATFVLTSASTQTAATEILFF